ncbi:MAG: hypothetical protein RIF36_15925 [Imperialibacter sp.]
MSISRRIAELFECFPNNRWLQYLPDRVELWDGVNRIRNASVAGLAHDWLSDLSGIEKELRH